MNTKQIAGEIVSGLSDSLSHADLPTVRSVFVFGSYCRGDWLDSSSDLDITVILRDVPPAAREHDLQWIYPERPPEPVALEDCKVFARALAALTGRVSPP